MTEAERLALITHEQVRLVRAEAELVEQATVDPNDDEDDEDGEHSARAFNVSREAKRRPYGLPSAAILPFVRPRHD